MSFGNSQKIFSGVQEALVLALMLLSVFALFYFDIALMYKVGIAVIVLSVIFLTTLATQILREQKESRKAAVTA
jgi:hypothetical protein